MKYFERGIDISHIGGIPELHMLACGLLEDATNGGKQVWRASHEVRLCRLSGDQR